MKKSVLVTGGAGYIGSHTVLQLVQSGFDVVVLDNLYSGHQWAIAEQAHFYLGDIHDTALLDKIFSQHDIDTVIHFAGYVVAPESVSNPAKYYHNNVVGSLLLIETCVKNSIRNFIFSSSAAVYGVVEQCPVAEQAPLQPISPYGQTKLITEMTLKDFSQAYDDFNYVALRYFNVAGANMAGKLGCATDGATHLIKVACETALGKRASMSIFGDDYDTQDGTGIRDFIHVDDLANAHLHAMNYLHQSGNSVELNCGYGNGYSVKQVIECVKKISNNDFVIHQKPRREGDIPVMISDNRKILEICQWRPQYNDLFTICESAYKWEAKL